VGKRGTLIGDRAGYQARTKASSSADRAASYTQNQEPVTDLFAGTDHSLARAYARLANTEPEPARIIIERDEEVPAPPFDESLIEGIWHRRFRVIARDRFTALDEVADLKGQERDEVQVNLSNGYTLYLLRHSYGWTASFRPPGEEGRPTRPIHRLGATKKPRAYPQTVGKAIEQWAGFLRC